MTRYDELKQACEEVNLWIACWSPGDGVTRYRFFEEPGNTYFGPASGIHTALGWAQANLFLTGFAQGYHHAKQEG